MIAETSKESYFAIVQDMPAKCRPVYAAIFNKPDLCISEIGQLCNLQNSSVSGRVNDLIDSGLIRYVKDAQGEPEKKKSPISDKLVMKIRAYELCKVRPNQVKQPEVKELPSKQNQFEMVM